MPLVLQGNVWLSRNPRVGIPEPNSADIEGELSVAGDIIYSHLVRSSPQQMDLDGSRVVPPPAALVELYGNVLGAFKNIPVPTTEGRS